MCIMEVQKMYLKIFYNILKRIVFLSVIFSINILFSSCKISAIEDISKLTREDFKVSGNNSIVNATEDDNFLSLFSSNDTFGIATFVDGDDIFTNRQISIGNTIIEVENKYGKQPIKIFQEADDELIKFLYEKVESIFDLSVLSDGDIYTEYEWQDGDKKYYIRFFFDGGSSKVKLIMFYFGI